jgi:glycolate oxidase
LGYDKEALVKKKLIKELQHLVGTEGVLWQPEELLLYEYDASPGLPVVGRGAGTGLSGGALAPRGGLMIVFSRMKRILEIDLENLRAVVEPGVVNLDVTKEVEHAGCYFAPDPSSQKSCTIGGNVAENAGGPHTLAYGVTTNHVLGLELVLPTGELVEIGSRHLDTPGCDLTGLMVGSEGTMALVTKAVLRLSRLPETVQTLLATFETLDDAAETVADLTARRITPAACEMLDQFCLGAVEAATHAGFPLDAAACLLIELEGLREAVTAQAEQVDEVCRAHHARRPPRPRGPPRP